MRLLKPIFGFSVLTACISAHADCFSKFSRKACGPEANYSRKQKAADVEACQVKEREEAKKKALERERQRAAKEAKERAAIEAINKSNKAVHTQAPTKRNDGTNAAPAKPIGTTF